MYINLKVHTDYTLLLGVGKLNAYLEKALEFGQKSIAITNTSLFNAIEFYQKAKKLGIKPILALEVNTEYDTLTVYAKNLEGYKALVYLATKSKPELRDVILHKNNLIVTYGGVNSKVYTETYENSLEILSHLKAKFEDFYFELPYCADYNKYISLLKELDLKPLISNDTYYVNKGDDILQLIVSAIRENRSINKVDNKYKGLNLNFKSYEDIKNEYNLDEDIFKEGLENISRIESLCNVEIDFSKLKMPIYKKDIDDKDYLRKLAYEGLKRITKENDETYIKRLDYELSIIDKMGFNSYFLITRDIVKYANKKKILVGIGRGSAPSSLVSYLIEITKIDPIKYKLIFERFLNVSRKSMPDIDLDFEAKRKDEIISYVVDRYGINYVANIITFSSLKEKQIKADLKRVLNVRLGNEKEKFVINSLLDNVRHRSIHASGVIISRDPLIEEIPVIYDENNNTNITQYNMKELEALGLLKMDFLSLTNLDIIADTINHLNISLDDIPLDDEKTFELYNKGETVGLFQVESKGITRLIKDFKIHNVEDIAIALALFRPGPLGSGMVQNVIARKNALEKIEYDIDDLKDILDETYGVMIYQEQVMRIAQKIAGFSNEQSDELRRAISKKIPSIIDKYRVKFIENSIEKGYNKAHIENLYHNIEAFGDYGFNKSHSISYGIISYYTAYLKANYTKEYMLALLNNSISDFNKLNIYFNELIKNDINLLACDINKSYVNFVIEGNDIRYALYSVSEVSRNLSEDIVKERDINGEYTDITDFVYRLLRYGLSKKQLEALIRAKCFNSFNISRKELLENVDELYGIAKKRRELDENIGQSLFFEEEDNKKKNYVSKHIEEYLPRRINEMECLSLGLPLSCFSSNVYMLLKKVLLLGNNLDLAYISNDNILSGGIRYKLSYANEKNLVGTIALVLKNKEGISKIYSLDLLSKLKNISVELLLDNLIDEQKLALKNILKNNKGKVRVNFYENETKLNKSVYVDLSIKLIFILIKKIGETNIRIKIANLN